MFKPLLNFLAANWIIFFHSFLHLDFHVKYLLVVLRAELLLHSLHLGEEDFIFVQRAYLQVIMNLTRPLFG